MSDTSIKISQEAYKKLKSIKYLTGVPVKTQIDRWLEVKGDKHGKKSTK